MPTLKEGVVYTTKVTSWILIGSLLFAGLAVLLVRTANFFGYGY